MIKKILSLTKDLRDLDLSETRFYNYDLSDVNLGGANLRGSNLKYITYNKNTNFSLVKYDSRTIFPEFFNKLKHFICCVTVPLILKVPHRGDTIVNSDYLLKIFKIEREAELKRLYQELCIIHRKENENKESR